MMLAIAQGDMAEWSALQTIALATDNKKLSYRRETARQLPTPPPPPLATPMRMVESETRNKRTSRAPFTKRTLR